jgi:TRAP-type transport system small permease protein
MFDKIFRILRAIIFGFSVTAMSIMLIIIFGQVISRYLFGYTPEWSEELARFLFVWVVFLGSALIMGESGHLAVQFVPEHFKGRLLGKILEILILFFSYVFILILMFQGSKMTSMMTFQTAPGIGISMSYVYAVIPVSSVLMLFYLVRNTITIFRGFVSAAKKRG